MFFGYKEGMVEVYAKHKPGVKANTSKNAGEKQGKYRNPKTTKGVQITYRICRIKLTMTPEGELSEPEASVGTAIAGETPYKRSVVRCEEPEGELSEPEASVGAAFAGETPYKRSVVRCEELGGNRTPPCININPAKCLCKQCLGNID